MNVRFKNDKLQKLCLTKKFQKEHNLSAYKQLQNLLFKLQAASSMYEFWPEYSGKERCHELKNKKHRDFRNHFSFTIIDKLRLIALPEVDWIASDSATRTWADIHSITVVYAGDYHDD